MSKKTKIVLIILLALTLGWIVYQAFEGQIQNSKYGLEISVVEAASTFVECQVDCLGTRENDSLHISSTPYSIERRTLYGWKPLEIKSNEFSDVMRKYNSLREETTYDFKIKFENNYGELAKGTYRIKLPIYKRSDDVSVFYRDKMVGKGYAIFKVSESGNTSFLMSSWWDVIVFVFILILLFGMFWILLRFHIGNKLKCTAKKILIKIINMEQKKRVIVAGVLVGVLLASYFLFCELQSPFTNMMYGISASVKESNSTRVKGSVTHTRRGSRDIPCAGSEYIIEKRTVFGWKRVVSVLGGDEFSQDVLTGIIEQEERAFDIEWSGVSEELPNGKYRIRYPVYEYNAGKMQYEQKGCFFIPFEISE